MVADDIIAKRRGPDAVSSLVELKAVAQARNVELAEDASVWALF
jgi:hypothetical protein